MENKRKLILLFVACCGFLACGTKKAITDNGGGSTNSGGSDDKGGKTVTITGSFESVAGVMNSLSCYCGNGGYLTQGDKRIAVCFDDLGIEDQGDCPKMTVTGVEKTLKNDPEPTSPCRKGEMKVVMATAKNGCDQAPDVKRKPIIYLYPEQETEVNVRLEFNGELTHTYPKYNPQTGWQVTAAPNGNLVDAKTGKEYYALYWEGESVSNYDLNKGFVVHGNTAADFLNEKLATLGLNRKEANEFMVYWLPELEKNEYNLVHFAQQSYTDGAALEIKPEPETLIRVFMVMQPLENQITIDPQQLQPVQRKGFTVVEWGGTVLPKAAN